VAKKVDGEAKALVEMSDNFSTSLWSRSWRRCGDRTELGN